MKRSLTIVVAALGAACHRIPPSDLELSPTEAVQGSYEYQANIQGREIRGRFAIIGKNVVFSSKGAACENLTRHVNSDVATSAYYGCDGMAENRVHFFISFRSPTTQSTWSSFTTGRRTRQICDEYGIGRDGREVCRRSHFEQYDVDLPIGGALNVRRVDESVDRIPE